MIILIMTIFPLMALLGTVWKNKTVAKWIPGFFCLFMTFVCTNAEALILPDTFNFFEHFFSMMIGITMAGAAILELYNIFNKSKYRRISPIKKEVVE
ncbi:MAG: hypothetical protein ACFFAT_06085 [Promethearchaeota archaeon]